MLFLARTPSALVYESLVEVLRSLGEQKFVVRLLSPEGDAVASRSALNLGIDWQTVAADRRLTSLRMAWRAVLLLWSGSPVAVAGTDATSGAIAAGLAMFFRVRFFYFGLELPSHKSEAGNWWRGIERWTHRRADLIITMDKAHADFICRETGVLRERILLIPNSARGPGCKHRTRTLRDRFNLSDTDVVVLHAGGIGAAQGSKELADAAKKWKAGRHLVFHAHCPMDHELYFRQFTDVVRGCANVHLNTQSVAPYELDNIIAGTDIGIAWYDRDRLGFRADLLGLAAGKIGRYLRNGVPVIVRDLPTVRAYVDEYHCGICIDTISDSAPAIETIMSRYEEYSTNALRCYEELWRPDRHLAEFRARFEKMIAGRTHRSASGSVDEP